MDTPTLSQSEAVPPSVNIETHAHRRVCVGLCKTAPLGGFAKCVSVNSLTIMYSSCVLLFVLFLMTTCFFPKCYCAL